jgi:tRNA pseudouridine38-40 synthase
MLKVILKFDGHDFYGWQFQTQTSPTVQEKFNKALEAIYKVPVKTMASGRTDTGVHSLEHHVVFKEPFNIPCEKLIKALNSNLPDSIRVFECNSVDDHFRPTNDAIKREYRYFFSNDEIVNPFSRKFMSNISYNLNYKMMEKACELFIGEHDFNSFHCVGSNPTSTVRTIFNCELSKQDSCMNGVIPGHYVVSVTGSVFL